LTRKSAIEKECYIGREKPNRDPEESSVPFSKKKNGYAGGGGRDRA